LSGRCINNKKYAFKKRPWEENYIESIDISDSLSVPLRIYSNGKKVKRILPQSNSDLNISWITERTRFLYDSLFIQQLDYPTIRILSNFNKDISEDLMEELIFYKKFYYDFIPESELSFFFREDNKPTKFLKHNYIAMSWKSITFLLLNRIKPFFGAYCLYYLGEFLDLETQLHIKESGLYYSSNDIKKINEHYFTNSQNLINSDFDFNYIFKNSNFDNYQNFLFVNLNLRIENPILNAKLRQKFLWDTKTNIFVIGSKYNLTYKYIHLGLSTKILLTLVEGRNPFLNKLKNNLNKNLLLYNSNLKYCYKTIFHKSFLIYLKKIFDVNYLGKDASSIGYFDLSLDKSINKSKKQFIKLRKNTKYTDIFYYIGCNNIKLNSRIFFKNIAHKIFIYQNNYGDNFFWFADFFLPSYSYSEKENGYYINCFGILRKTRN
jgi:NADH-quinone oxidoreductase subunit G